MERYDSAPERVIAGWPSTDGLHPANERVRDLLSAALTFRTVKGIYLDRDGYLGRPQPKPAVVKSSSGSVQVLYATAETILLSTVVETQGADGVRASFANARLFIKEDGLWKCRVWLNSPEPSTS